MNNKVNKKKKIFNNMKIGVFDSGVGGLIITKAIQIMMPEYDYIYLGDTKRVPYGNRSQKTIFKFTREGVDYLFRKENCAIVIIACNTISVHALKRIQQEYLPIFCATPDVAQRRKVLGVLIPTAEECVKFNKIGILGTSRTISSRAFPTEIKKILTFQNKNIGRNKSIKIFQNSALMLVLLAEKGEKILAKKYIKKYLKPFLNKPRRSQKSGPRANASGKIQTLVLACTHYSFYKNEIRKTLGNKITVISQDEIIPRKLKKYFIEHPEIRKKLSKNKKMKILVTKMTPTIMKFSKKWFGKDVKPKVIHFK